MAIGEAHCKPDTRRKDWVLWANTAAGRPARFHDSGWCGANVEAKVDAKKRQRTATAGGHINCSGVEARTSLE
jgi:hypothetical protein